jgi:uncharacterized protein DUF5047
MRPVSQALLAAVHGSHKMTVRARVVETYQTGVNPAGTDILVTDGDVVLDATANIRSTLDLTTDGTDMWPRTGGATLLAPYGNELFVERGVDLGGGGVEWVSLGYFRIEGPQQGIPPDGPIRITGSDRMAGIVDARLLTPRQYVTTDTYGAVVTDLVTEVYPAATILWDDATDLTLLGRTVIVEQDRYKFLNELVNAVGKIWYWNHRGELVIADPPDPTVPVFEVAAGTRGVLVAGSTTRHLTREGVYNAVVASGEAADQQAPVRAVAVDDNPDSPTYYYGTFGPVPRFFVSPFLVTELQAANAAASILRRSIGLPYSINFGLVPNPALEPYDPVTVRVSARDTAEVHILQRVTVPLTAGQTMAATTREQTTTVIGAGS